MFFAANVRRPLHLISFLSNERACERNPGVTMCSFHEYSNSLLCNARFIRSLALFLSSRQYSLNQHSPARARVRKEKAVLIIMRSTCLIAQSIGSPASCIVLPPLHP